MGKGGGGGSTTQTVKNEPWKEQKPYLEYGFQEARNIYDNQGQPAFYGGSNVAPFASETNLALDATTRRALGGSPISNAGQDEYLKTLQGDYLNPGSNPYLQQSVAAATRPVMDYYNDVAAPELKSMFAKSGRYGSGLADTSAQRLAEQTAQKVGDISSGIYSQNYNQERQRQAQFAANAPQYAASDYSDLQKLAAVGATREQKVNEILGGDVNRFNHYQTLPQDKLNDYMQLIQGNYGGTQTTAGGQGSGGSNPLLGALGGAASGFSLFGSGGALAGAGIGGPAGAAIGGGLSLLGGLFG